MTESQREALVLDFLRRLKEAGSWCGETHIQKSTYFLQEMMGVPFGLNYVFYKHGPFSFELTDLLTALRGNGLVDLRSHAPYGPHLEPSPMAGGYLSFYPKTVGQYEVAMDFIVSKLASKKVAELERLATALYVLLELPEEDDAVREKRIGQLKPHVSLPEARAALQDVERFRQEGIAIMSQ